jgi:hypothetical protein
MPKLIAANSRNADAVKTGVPLGGFKLEVQHRQWNLA